MATPNGTQFQVSTDNSFTTKLIDYSGAYETSHAVTTGTLTKGVPLYSRVRHSSVETGYSAWSPTRQFSIALVSLFIEGFKKTYSNTVEGVVTGENNTKYIFGTVITNSQGTTCQSFITKINFDGTVVWQKQYTGISWKNMLSKGGFFHTDGYLYVIGTYGYFDTTMSGNGTVGGNAVFMKISPSNGNIVWQKKITEQNIPQIVGSFITALPNGNLLVLAYWYLTSPTSRYGAYLFEFSLTSMNIVWQKYVYGIKTSPVNESFVPQCLCVSPSGEIYIGGKNGYLMNDYYISLVKLDSSGNIQWSQLFPASPVSIVNNIKLLSDGSLIGVGNYGSNSIIFKVSSTGSLVWCKTYAAGTFYGLEVDKSTNTIYACGIYNGNALITKWDSSGNIQVQKSLNGTGTADFFNNICLGSNGDLLIIGCENSSSSYYTTIAISAKLSLDDGSGTIAGYSSLSWVSLANTPSNTGILISSGSSEIITQNCNAAISDGSFVLSENDQVITKANYT